MYGETIHCMVGYSSLAAVSLGERPDVGLKAQTGLVDVGLGHDA